jgi:antitoxin (DNA-binding transcriptional repressor) of toxin-antitoxin stability system
MQELAAKLDRYIRRVRSGEVVRVADQGRVVAEIRAHRDAQCLRDLVNRGVVRPGLPGRASYPPSPLRSPPGTAATLLDEERGES